VLPNRLRWGIVISITVVWLINFFAGLLVDSYEPDQAINGIFMGTVGIVLAAGSRNKEANGDG
jgi:hypothetical protein